MPRVIHFDFLTDEPERAIRFYSEAFGWSIQKWDGPMDYWLIKTGEDSEPGIDGGLTKRTADEPFKTINTIGVVSLDDTMAKITQAGGTITVPRMPIPGVGYL